MDHRHHSTAARAASLATLVLAALLTVRARDTGATALGVLQASGAVVAFAGGARMAHQNSFESRMAAVLAAGGTVVSAVLAMTVGVPGRESQGTSWGTVTLLVTGALICLLVAVDARVRHAAPGGTPPPYAL